MTMPFETKLSQSLQEKARRELHEEINSRHILLNILKDKILANGALQGRTDDSFLIRFLRARKFHVDEAFKLYANYYLVRAKNEQHLRGISLNDLPATVHDNVSVVLPIPDGEGRKILYLRPGRWRDDVYSVYDIIKVMIISLEKLVVEEETQVNGVVLIVDFKDVGMQRITHAKPSFNMVIDVLQDAFPLRLKSTHVVNEPFYWDPVLTFIKLFLKQKMHSRTHIHGKNFKLLHETLSPSILPEELGGNLGPTDELAFDWNTELLSCAEETELIFKESGINFEVLNQVHKDSFDSMASNDLLYKYRSENDIKLGNSGTKEFDDIELETPVASTVVITSQQEKSDTQKATAGTSAVDFQRFFNPFKRMSHGGSETNEPVPPPGGKRATGTVEDKPTIAESTHEYGSSSFSNPAGIARFDATTRFNPFQKSEDNDRSVNKSHTVKEFVPADMATEKEIPPTAWSKTSTEVPPTIWSKNLDGAAQYVADEPRDGTYKVEEKPEIKLWGKPVASGSGAGTPTFDRRSITIHDNDSHQTPQHSMARNSHDKPFTESESKAKELTSHDNKDAVHVYLPNNVHVYPSKEVPDDHTKLSYNIKASDDLKKEPENCTVMASNVKQKSLEDDHNRELGNPKMIPDDQIASSWTEIFSTDIPVRNLDGTDHGQLIENPKYYSMVENPQPGAVFDISNVNGVPKIAVNAAQASAMESNDEDRKKNIAGTHSNTGLDANDIVNLIGIMESNSGQLVKNAKHDLGSN